MDQVITQNLEERERTRAALTYKLELLEERLRDRIENVREAVRHTTDVRYQVSQRPWRMLGLSVFVGFALSGLLRRRRRRSRMRSRPLRRTAMVDPVAQQRSVMKGATIAAIASIVNELARHLIPFAVRRLEQKGNFDYYTHGPNEGP
jgi:ElaB/YqjD/DUF883 family membrane-anchored ribosome-binding protein